VLAGRDGHIAVPFRPCYEPLGPQLDGWRNGGLLACKDAGGVLPGTPAH